MSYWFVLLVQKGLTFPSDPGPVRYKAPDTMTWAITQAETRGEAVERARENTELVPYAAARLEEYELV